MILVLSRYFCQQKGYATGDCQGKTGWDCECMSLKEDGEFGKKWPNSKIGKSSQVPAAPNNFDLSVYFDMVFLYGVWWWTSVTTSPANIWRGSWTNVITSPANICWTFLSISQQCCHLVAIQIELSITVVLNNFALYQ